MRAHTLSQALVSGSGIERPFLCPDHADTRPSASVNVLKGKWYCYTCGSRGEAGEDHPVSLDALATYVRQQLMEPATYPESWLNLYDAGDPHEYWLSRFTEQAVRRFRLGFDLERDAVTLPLRDNGGRVLGVVRRKLGDTGPGPRYLYPFGVDIGRCLFNYSADQLDFLVLTEGATDAIAAWEAGWDAFAIYGARISTHQVRLIDRVDPKVVLTAFDADEAGHQAHAEVTARLPYRLVARVRWGAHAKDLCDLSVEERQNALKSTLDNVGQLIIGSDTCGSYGAPRSPQQESSVPTPSTTSSRRVRLRTRPTPSSRRLNIGSSPSSRNSS